MDTVLLGKVTAPVGIKGEFRVYCNIDDQARFSAIKNVLVGSDAYTVEHVRFQKGMAVMKLQEIGDRNSSELLRNLEIRCTKEEFGSLPEDTFFSDELVGLNVVSDTGSPVGVLSDVIKNPAHDLYEITLPGTGKKVLIPAVKEYVLDIDPENEQMTLHLIDGILDL